MDQPLSDAPQQRTAASVTVVQAKNHSELLQQIYVAYYGRPADPRGLAFWANAYAAAKAPLNIPDLLKAYETSAAIRALVDTFGVSLESQDLYAGEAREFVTAIYQNLFNRDPEKAGLDYWVNAIEKGILTRPVVALAIMSGAQSADSESVSKKVAAADIFTRSLDTDALIKSYDGSAANSVGRRTLNQVTSSTQLTGLGEIVRLAIPEVVKIPTLPTFKLTSVSTVGNGRGTITPISGTFRQGETVGFRNSPDFFSEQYGWTSRSVCAGKMSSCRVTVTSDLVAEARFEPTVIYMDIGEINYTNERKISNTEICRWAVKWSNLRASIFTRYASSTRVNTLQLTGNYQTTGLLPTCGSRTVIVDKTFSIPTITSKNLNVSVVAMDGVGDQILTITGEIPPPAYEGVLYSSGLGAWSIKYANTEGAKGEAGNFNWLQRRKP